MAKLSNSIWALLIIAAVAVLLGLLAQNWRNAPPELQNTILLPTPKAVPVTQFATHENTPFSSDDFAGQWHLLFFGFTHCPDVCPTTLYTLKQAYEQLTELGVSDRLQISMVTVDPARDTPDRLAQYVPFFHPDFVGLTASEDTLAQFSKALGVLYVARAPDDSGNYDVDHSAALILINPEGQYAGAITAPHKVDELVHDLSAIIGSQDQRNSGDVKQTDMASTVALSNAWIRPAPPGVDSLAGYLDIANQGDKKVEITGASSPMFEEIMIHTSSISDGMATMDEVGKLVVASDTSLSLLPMGTHLMLMEPISSIALGQLVPVTLLMSDGSSAQVIFEVRHGSGTEQ